eukprot:9868223-Alexandrium_andersonii.AAC.1
MRSSAGAAAARFFAVRAGGRADVVPSRQTYAGQWRAGNLAERRAPACHCARPVQPTRCSL